MKRIRFIVTLTALTAICAPSAASAQDCYSLVSERDSINREASALAQYEWGSALVFGGCLVAGMSNYEQNHSQADAVAAVTVCAGASCGLTTDYRNCLAVCARLFIYALRVALIEDQMRNRNC